MPKESADVADEQVKWLTSIDPHFPVNNRRHASFGKPCGAGENSFTVDGAGTIRRCHFVGTPLGSIQAEDWQACLSPRNCPNATCGCHIGYVHLKHLGQEAIYGDNLLERIPGDWKASAESDSSLVPLQ